jgi:sulfonate transport system ATP-binding protein
LKSTGGFETVESLEIKNLRKTFHVGGKAVPVLDGINLRIVKGEFVSVVGHSGCGKSTILKIVAGLVEYSEGLVHLDGKPITGPGLERGMIFQDHRLLPWLTVYENIALGLYKHQGKNLAEAVAFYIKLVSLTGFESAYPHQLSGGMAQRAAIARALAHHPEILLLDEPFGSLDALTRILLQQEVLRIWENQRTTMILVTHDIDEAIYLSDRVIVLSNRPARIQKTFQVELARPRDRTSYDFSLIRKKIYEEFFENQKQEGLLEYFL